MTFSVQDGKLVFQVPASAGTPFFKRPQRQWGSDDGRRGGIAHPGYLTRTNKPGAFASGEKISSPTRTGLQLSVDARRVRTTCVQATLPVIAGTFRRRPRYNGGASQWCERAIGGTELWIDDDRRCSGGNGLQRQSNSKARKGQRRAACFRLTLFPRTRTPRTDRLLAKRSPGSDGESVLLGLPGP